MRTSQYLSIYESVAVSSFLIPENTRKSVSVEKDMYVLDNAVACIHASIDWFAVWFCTNGLVRSTTGRLLVRTVVHSTGSTAENNIAELKVGSILSLKCPSDT